MLPWLHCIASYRIKYTHFLSRNMRRFNIYSPSPIPLASIFSATQLKIWFNLMIPLPYTVYTIHNVWFLLHLDNTGESDLLGCAKIFEISRADLSVSFPIHTTNVEKVFRKWFSTTNKPTPNAIMPFNVKMCFRIIFAYSLILINWIP